MDLDELKIQLDKEAEQGSTRSPNDLAALLKRTPSSLVNGIRKSLRIEMGISIIFTIICTVIPFTDIFWSMKIYFGIFAVVGIGFVVILYYLLKKINTYEQRPLPLKENLREISAIIREYTKRYFQFSIALMPICIFLSVWLSFLDEGRTHPTHVKWTFVIPFFAFVILLCVGIYYFNKWYLRKLYGRYVEEIDRSITELEEND